MPLIFDGTLWHPARGPLCGLGSAALPVVTSISRAFGSTSGDTVPFIFNGTNLIGATAKINGVAVPAQTILSATQIRVDATPALAAAIYDVSATSPAGSSAPLVGAYEAAPIVGWYRADYVVLASGRVATEIDKSGNSLDFSQPLAGFRPYYNLIDADWNNNPSVSYDGASWTYCASKSALKCLHDGTGGTRVEVVKLGDGGGFSEMGLGIGGTGSNIGNTLLLTTTTIGSYIANGLATVVASSLPITPGDKRKRIQKMKVGASPEFAVYNGATLEESGALIGVPSSADCSIFPTFGAGAPAGSYASPYTCPERLFFATYLSAGLQARVVAYLAARYP